MPDGGFYRDWAPSPCSTGCPLKHQPEARPKSGARQSVLQHPLEQFDIILQAEIGTDGGLDLAHGMQDSRMVTPAEPAADFGQGAQGQDLGQIHRHLARLHHTGRAAR